MRQAGRQPEKGGCGRAPPAGSRVSCASVAQACSGRARLAGHRISCASSAPACSGRARPAGRLGTCLFAGKTSYGPAPLAGHRNAPAPAAPSSLQTDCAGTAAAAAISADPQACRCRRGARGRRAPLTGHSSSCTSSAPACSSRARPAGHLVTCLFAGKTSYGPAPQAERADSLRIPLPPTFLRPPDLWTASGLPGLPGPFRHLVPSGLPGPSDPSDPSDPSGLPGLPDPSGLPGLPADPPNVGLKREGLFLKRRACSAMPSGTSPKPTACSVTPGPSGINASLHPGG